MLVLPLLGAAEGDRCAALRDAGTPQLEITVATAVGNMCRVEAVARPRPNAAIGIELWLPAPDKWSGRYYQMGNGGFAGRIDRPTLSAAAARGDAAAATDTGHKGDGFDASWAAGRPDLVEDYAGRSIKVTANAANGLIRRYYGAAPRKRYFMGCSFGGRQALVAAARWPADWDGVIAGAPAVDWPRRIEGFARIQHALRGVPGGWIAPDRIAGMAAVVRDACRVGRSDCTVSALRRACRVGMIETCLIAPQEAALRTIEAAGYPLADADPAEWRRWILNPDVTAPSQLTLATQGYRWLFGVAWVPQDAASTPDPARVALFATGRLRPFLAKGGKILSYFGTADAVLPPAFAVADARSLGGDSGPTGAYRLFMVPGMAHCQGGNAPHAFGQSLVAPAMADDPRHDVRRALEDWVERGVAPRTLIAATIGAGPRRTVALRPILLGVARKR